MPSVTAAGSLMTISFDRPVIVSGPIAVETDVPAAIVQQTVVDPQTVTLLFSVEIDNANYSLPANQLTIRTYQGGPNAPASGSLAATPPTLAQVLAAGNDAANHPISNLGAGSADTALAVNTNSVTSLDGGLIRANGKGALNIAAASANIGTAGLTGAILQIRCAPGAIGSIRPFTTGSTIPGSLNFPVSKINVLNPQTALGPELTLQVITGSAVPQISAFDTVNAWQIPLQLTASEIALDAAPNGQGSPTDGYVTTNLNTLDDGAGNLTAIALHASNGASGSFLTADGKTVTVTDGIITAIA